MIRKMFFSLVLLSSCAEVRSVEGDRCDNCLHCVATGCLGAACLGIFYSEGRAFTIDSQGNFKRLFKYEPSLSVEVMCPLATACCAFALNVMRDARLKNIDKHKKSE